MPIRIHNVRLGLATNSSSSHSIILLDPRRGPFHDNDVEGASFGWQHFTAVSPEAKRTYLAHQVLASLRHLTSSEQASAIVREWVGDGIRLDDEGLVEGYIDHESQYSFPLSWDGKGLDREFVRDYERMLMRDGVAVLGSNDNDGEGHPLSSCGTEITPQGKYDSVSRCVARKDPTTGAWTLFNRSNGAKIRVTFDDRNGAIEKAHAPELVDVKTTNWCNANCAFCYQDSTTAGKHADKNLLWVLASVLGELRVFEVALGGGEPTAHPDFADILHTFRYNGVVPNFTTKTLEWLRDPGRRVEYLREAGAFAFSVDDGKDVDRLAAALASYGAEPCGRWDEHHSDLDRVMKPRCAVQFVVGAHYEGFLDDVLDRAAVHNFPVTLLGYKTVGRGAGYEVQEHKGWLGALVKAMADHRYGLRVGVDTALAAEVGQAALDKVGVARWSYGMQEGKFSMYIDAVEGRIAPSSYCDPLAMRRVDLGRLDCATLLDAFATW